MDHVLAIDPGPDLGMARRTPSGKIESWQIFTVPLTHPYAIVTEFLHHLNVDEPIDRMILEPFSFNKVHKDRGFIDYNPAEWVGALKLFCEQEGIPYTLQQPSLVVGTTAFWGDASPGNTKLRTIGLWVPDKMPSGGPKKNNAHQRDALRHLVYRLCNVEGDKSFLWLLRDKKKYNNLLLDRQFEL